MPSRRRVLTMLAAAGAAGAGGWALLAGGRANAYYQGAVSDHFDGVQVLQPRPARTAGRAGAAALEAHRPRRSVAAQASRARSRRTGRPGASMAMRCASSTSAMRRFLIQTQGRNVLLDPVWSERASPLFLGPKRVNAPGIAFDDLPPIDTVLVTHNHYDHMDVETDRAAVAALSPAHRHAARQRHDPQGRRAGVSRPMRSIGTRRSISAAGSRVHVEPTLHWSARGATDRSHALWASFVLQAGARKVYCVGDSALRRRRHVRAACASGTASWRWRCCRSAPTSRAGSCARAT